jgi:hypothetical protein
MLFRIRTLIIALFLFSTACAQGQTEKPVQVSQSQVKVGVEQLLSARTYTVAIMDGVIIHPRLQVLLQKFQAGIQKNPEVLQNMQKATGGKPGPLPYDRRFGLTKPEYEEFQAFMERREIKSASSGTEQVTVSNQDGIIRFAAQGKLAVMNSIWLDLNQNKAHVKDYVLPFSKTLNITESTNAFDSQWMGYMWEFMEPNDLDLSKIDLKNPGSLHIIGYKIIVGKLAKTGQTLVQVKGTEVKDGVRTVGFEMPLFFE